MSSNTAVTIAFIGFGEVGQTFSRGLATRPGVTLTAWDRLFATDADARLRAAAAETGVRVGASAAEAARGADVLISAVTADETEAVAAEAAAFLSAGQIFLDVNSSAPATKCRAARLVEATGAHYVEGAVMAPVLRPGLAVPILTGGPEAAETALRLNGLGMNLRAVAVEHGRASAMKLCRSIVIKGLEVLLTQSATAARAWGVADEVFASLAGTYPSIDWTAVAADMAERVATHGVRRAAEMREVVDMLRELGLDPRVAAAVADAQQAGARPKS